jgi:hypothetical protein
MIILKQNKKNPLYFLNKKSFFCQEKLIQKNKSKKLKENKTNLESKKEEEEEIDKNIVGKELKGFNLNGSC